MYRYNTVEEHLDRLFYMKLSQAFEGQYINGLNALINPIVPDTDAFI